MPESDSNPMVAPEDASAELRMLHASVSSMLLAVTAYLNNTTALEIAQHYGDISGELMENFASMGETDEDKVARLADSAQRSFTMLIHSTVTVAEYYRRYLEAEDVDAGLPPELTAFLREGMEHVHAPGEDAVRRGLSGATDKDLENVLRRVMGGEDQDD